MGRIHELSPEWPHSDHFTGLGIILVFSDLFFFFFPHTFESLKLKPATPLVLS